MQLFKRAKVNQKMVSAKIIKCDRTGRYDAIVKMSHKYVNDDNKS